MFKAGTVVLLVLCALYSSSNFVETKDSYGNDYKSYSNEAIQKVGGGNTIKPPQHPPGKRSSPTKRDLTAKMDEYRLQENKDGAPVLEGAGKRFAPRKRISGTPIPPHNPPPGRKRSSKKKDGGLVAVEQEIKKSDEKGSREPPAHDMPFNPIGGEKRSSSRIGERNPEAHDTY